MYPALLAYIPSFHDLYERLLPRLRESVITLPNGTKFNVWDPEHPFRIAKWALDNKLLDAMSPEDKIRMIWDPGWWRYAPDVAEELLKSVGFSRGPDGKWRLPDGTPWRITITSAGPWEIDAMRMAYGIAEQWIRFGIDVKVETVDHATFWSQP
ncbi:MAG: ABC transporter substrate-binding protein, partial [Desulfurococcaceae archaeon]